MKNLPKFIIAADCDEVLFHISGKWMNKILNNPKIRNLLKDEMILKAEASHPNNRFAYPLTSHLTSFGFTENIEKLILDEYFQDSSFYDDIIPSSYFVAVIEMMKKNLIKEFWVISSCKDTKLPVTRSKMKNLEKYLGKYQNAVDIHYIFTEGKEKKSDVINNYEIKYNSFVDDCMDNIVDAAANTDSADKEFLIPRYRYNLEIPDDIKKLMLLHKLNVQWFDNDFINPNGSNILVDKLHTHAYESWNKVI